jgi:UDP-glucose 4-epimerase
VFSLLSLLLDKFVYNYNYHMNNLVIGGAGFIGSQLCDSLLLLGDNVVCLDNLMRGVLENLEFASKNPHFTFIKGDANDEKLLTSIMKENKIDFVYHLAANSDIQASANDPSIEFSCTCSTTWHVLMAMKSLNVRNFFFASSSAVYGRMSSGKPFDEDSPMHPISYYGSAKMASEAFISAFSFMNDMNSLVFRFPNVIGKRLTHGVIFDFINQLQKDPSHLQILGDGTQTKPYIYCDDLVRIIVQLSKINKGYNIYQIGTSGASSVRFIANSIINEMGLSNCDVKFGEQPFGWKGDVPVFQYNLSKIHKYGWYANLNSDEAVVATIKDALRKD